MKILKKSKSIISLIVLGILLFTNCGIIVNAETKGSYDDVEKIETSEMFEQTDTNYYVYFYREDCSDCNFVKEKVLNFAKENKVYFIDYGLPQNQVNSYNWKELQDKYNKKVGYLDENEEIVFFPGESYEKYENQKNIYGKKITYSFRIIGNDVYTNIMTPEIDYSNTMCAEDLIIAGVPTLFYMENGKLKEFYFDSFEINDFIQ